MQEPRGCKGSVGRPWLPALRFTPAGMTIEWMRRFKRSFSSAFPAKAGIQSSYKQVREAPRWTP